MTGIGARACPPHEKYRCGGSWQQHTHLRAALDSIADITLDLERVDEVVVGDVAGGANTGQKKREGKG